MEITKIGLDQLKERIRNIHLYPPDGMKVEELSCWLRGAEHMHASVIHLIKDLEDDQHD